MFDDVILICLYRQTSEFIIVYLAAFGTQMTLLLSYELRKRRNSVKGNVQVRIHIFNKDCAHFS